ncbi:hypothetical protein ACIQGT_25830 [Streptomyces sp. NPDC093108]|uniref:hypothetical protein n=1 Tax=Streptomyces sp. NPDC093108 TaxID=3366030 RepID=UPI00381C5B20
MTIPDVNAGELPTLTATRPGLRSTPAQTVRDLFGHDGQFFAVPGSFPSGLPDHITFAEVVYYAVVRIPNPDSGADVFTVRDVDGRHRTLGVPAPDLDAVLRSALCDLAANRRAYAQQVEHNRVHTRGLQPVPPVRIGYTTTGTCIVHVRCACLEVERLAAHFEHVSLAAADWLDETSTTPWEFCPTSPNRVSTPTGEGLLVRTLRSVDGAAAVEIQSTDGRSEFIPLASVNGLA